MIHNTVVNNHRVLAAMGPQIHAWHFKETHIHHKDSNIVYPQVTCLCNADNTTSPLTHVLIIHLLPYTQHGKNPLNIDLHRMIKFFGPMHFEKFIIDSEQDLSSYEEINTCIHSKYLQSASTFPYYYIKIDAAYQLQLKFNEIVRDDRVLVLTGAEPFIWSYAQGSNSYTKKLSLTHALTFAACARHTYGALVIRLKGTHYNNQAMEKSHLCFESRKTDPLFFLEGCGHIKVQYVANLSMPRLRRNPTVQAIIYPQKFSWERWLHRVAPTKKEMQAFAIALTLVAVTAITILILENNQRTSHR